MRRRRDGPCALFETGRIYLCPQRRDLRCPWHGWEFDIRTGQSYCDPERIRTKAYPVDTASGATVIEGPYVAETVPVRVEENYIVIDV